ncbi:MAG: hypothetical protein ABUL67_01445 [Haliangium ochraceum]
MPRAKTPQVEPSPGGPAAAPKLPPPFPAKAASSLPPPPIVRSRKATLVSPIPARLAESMTQFREDSDGAPAAADESDYVVEVVDGPPKSQK